MPAALNLVDKIIKHDFELCMNIDCYPCRLLRKRLAGLIFKTEEIFDR